MINSRQKGAQLERDEELIRKAMTAEGFHQAWDAAGDREVMREFEDIRAYLSDGLWIWPCGAMVDEKINPMEDFHDTDKCAVCTKAIKEVLDE
jgi:hypothetical protein